MAQMVSGGRKEPRRSPTACRDLEPLAVLHVGLPPRDILHVPRVHQADLDPLALEDLVQGNPVDAGGLHRHGGDPALREPAGEGAQFLGEGPEAPDGPRVPIEGDAGVDLGGADVDAGGVRGEDREGSHSGRASAASGHGGLLGEGEGHGRQAAPVVRESGYSSKRDGHQTREPSGPHQ